MEIDAYELQEILNAAFMKGEVPGSWSYYGLWNTVAIMEYQDILHSTELH